MEIDIAVLSAIEKGIQPLYYKISSIIKDHYASKYKLADSQLVVYLEVNMSCLILKRCLEDLIEQAEEIGTEVVLMKPEEVVLMSTMATSIDNVKELSYQNGISLLEH